MAQLVTTPFRRSLAIVLAVVLSGHAEAQASDGTQTPLRLIIPAIGVDAPIEPVGLTVDRRMGIPSSRSTVGWYALGVTPGTPGNAVLAGHLDTHDGRPAVFWSLSQLPIGSELLIVAKDGTVLRFHSSALVSYRTKETPMLDLFGPTNSIHLNIITCAGQWDTKAGTYDHRLVAFAEYVGVAPDVVLPAPPSADRNVPRSDALNSGDTSTVVKSRKHHPDTKLKPAKVAYRPRTGEL